MSYERGLLAVELRPAGAMIRGFAENVSDRIAVLVLGEAEVRWLAQVALPAILADMAKVPSDPPVKIRDASNDDGQIKGQLAIDER